MGWKDDARKRSKEIGSGGKFKLVEGENTLRILPHVKGTKYAPHVEFPMHYDVGPKKTGVACGKGPNGRGGCWLCDSMIPKLSESPNRAKQAMAENMSSRHNLVINVAKVDPDSGEMSGPFKWTISARQLQERILNLLGSKKVDYHDPEKGRNVTITRTGSGKMDTRYSMVEADAEASEVPEEILKGIKALTVPQYSAGVQKAAYQGLEIPKGGGLDSEEDEEDERPKKKSKRDADEDEDFHGKKSKKRRDEDEDEDEPDDEDGDEDDEDDEDERPKGKGKRRAEEDDEDEDEPVKKKKGKKRDDDDEDEPDDDDEDEPDDDEDDEDGDEDDEDEDEPVKKKKGKKGRDEDEDDEDGDEDDEDGDEDESDDDDEDEPDDDDEDEDEKPSKKKVTKKATKKAAKPAPKKAAAKKPAKKKK